MARVGFRVESLSFFHWCTADKCIIIFARIFRFIINSVSSSSKYSCNIELCTVIRTEKSSIYKLLVLFSFCHTSFVFCDSINSNNFFCSIVPLDKEGITVPIVQSTRIDHARSSSCCIIVREFCLPIVSPGCNRLYNDIFSPEGKYAKDDSLPDRSVHDVFDHSS